MAMASSSSRIFVRGLPPSLTEQEFRAHFAKRYAVTDVKFFPRRRIGYVGFKTAADALAAVKYFNKSFIRMSRIGVEIAEAYESTQKPDRNDPKRTPAPSRIPSDATVQPGEQNPLKRKRDENDPKLQEFLGLMKPPSKQKSWLDNEIRPTDLARSADREDAKVTGEAKSEKVSSSAQPRTKREMSKKKPQGPAVAPVAEAAGVEQEASRTVEAIPSNSVDQPLDENQAMAVNGGETMTSDSDWLRSRTSRLLGLAEDENENDPIVQMETKDDVSSDHASQEQPKNEDTELEKIDPRDDEAVDTNLEVQNRDVEMIRGSRRLFVRNLPYTVEEDDLTELFGTIGDLEEVHVPYDSNNHAAKGFAYVEYFDPENAVEAFQTLDGTIFQGRLLHVLPAAAKRQNKVDEFAISKLPLKKQKEIHRKSEAASATFNWNSMYMNPDAVVSSIADKLGISKSELLDPTSSDAAVKQAQAETHVIQETRAYFEAHGVDLKAFGKRQRSETVILVKNFQYGTKEGDLRRLFDDFGDVTKFLMPASGTIAIVELSQAAQARAAFSGLAYRKIGSSVLFLEKAPKDIFKPSKSMLGDSDTSNSVVPRISTTDLLQGGPDQDSFETSTLFVKNLNFATTNENFRATFQALDGFTSARVKTKSDGRSAGFGFLEFRSNEQARAALLAMNGYSLDGHRLEMKASNKGLDAAEERRREDALKSKKMRKSKIIIKNLPFEASKKDVRNLFKTYGQLRAVRVPKKFDNTTKGFAFAEFTTPREAESAMDALRHVHFLGRRLNMEFASGEIEDPEKEIEKMQQKVGRQSNTMAIQKLKGTGRKKFNVNGTNEDEVDE